MRGAALRETCALGYRTIGGSKRRVFVSFNVEHGRPFRSPGVLKEVATAHILQKSVIQIVPYGAGSPHTIPNAGRVVRWEWDVVKRAVAAAPAFGTRRYSMANSRSRLRAITIRCTSLVPS